MLQQGKGSVAICMKHLNALTECPPADLLVRQLTRTPIFANEKASQHLSGDHLGKLIKLHFTAAECLQTAWKHGAAFQGRITTEGSQLRRESRQLTGMGTVTSQDFQRDWEGRESVDGRVVANEENEI